MHRLGKGSQGLGCTGAWMHKVGKGEPCWMHKVGKGEPCAVKQGDNTSQ